MGSRMYGEAAYEAIRGPGDVRSRLVVVDHPCVEELERRRHADVDTGLVHFVDDLVERESLAEPLLDAVLPEDVPEGVRPAVGGLGRHDRHPGVDGAHALGGGHWPSFSLTSEREMISRMISDVPAPIEKPATSR